MCARQTMHAQPSVLLFHILPFSNTLHSLKLTPTTELPPHCCSFTLNHIVTAFFKHQICRVVPSRILHIRPNTQANPQRDPTHWAQSCTQIPVTVFILASPVVPHACHMILEICMAARDINRIFLDTSVCGLPF